MTLDLKKIPRERWAGALAMLLAQTFAQDPPALFRLVADGEDAFATLGKKTDRFGITEKEYRGIYRKLRTRAKNMGLDVRLLKHGIG